MSALLSYWPLLLFVIVLLGLWYAIESANERHRRNNPNCPTCHRDRFRS